MEYSEFLASKQMRVPEVGKTPGALHPALFPFQADIAAWAVRKGRAAIFADVGLGKTLMQLEWARQINELTLIIAPLAVAQQTVNMARDLLGMEVRYVRSQDSVSADCKFYICNYEMIEHFKPERFKAVVLDESSILKQFEGKTRNRLVEAFKNTPYKLCCTATPSPNDYTELGNHAEFLGIMRHQEMLATFFTYDSSKTIAGSQYRLKGHARDAFYRWLSSWAVAIKKPSDLGYSDEGYDLPPLNIIPIIVKSEFIPKGMMFAIDVISATDAKKVRRGTISARAEESIPLLNNGEQWLIWTGLNAEAELLAEKVDHSFNLHGSLPVDEKVDAILNFVSGETRNLITKSSIAGMGVNFQHCHNMLFFGVDYSWEQFYQSIGRVYRFGQKHPVNVYVVFSQQEQSIYDAIQRKGEEAMTMMNDLITAARQYSEEEIRGIHHEFKYSTDIEHGNNWEIRMGDSCERMKEIPDNSVDLSIYSPPFHEVFVYSATERDLGNSKNLDEFFEHYSFIIRENLRITKPGRLACVHVADARILKQDAGFRGRRDFSGHVIEAYQDAGWVFWQRITVDKNPQALRDGTPVLTPHGWKAINALKVGDSVIGSDGKATEVIGVYPHDYRTMYRVTFSDGVSVDCDANHLWTVRKYGANKALVTMRTDELFGNLHSPGGKTRYQIPLTMPIEYAQSEALPVDPYLLGTLIGNGGLTRRSTVALTAEQDLFALLSLPDGHRFRHIPNSERGNNVSTSHILFDQWHENPLLNALRELGLHGKYSYEKRIPAIYQRASVANRWQLLKGLMDTDGTCKRNGGAYYATTSEGLAQDIIGLVRSLGGMTTLTTETPVYHHNDERRQGRLRYVITVRVNENPFKLARKADRWHRTRELRRAIVDIQAMDMDKCTCITVSNDDGLFVTKDFIVTHNSQAIRLKDHGLLFKTLKKDSTELSGGHPDYLLIFRKKGDNEVAVTPFQNGEVTSEDWIKWAHPVWYDIVESNVLNVAVARCNEDEKHMCPLQLDLIERCVKLYSNPGELVFSPFAGIGSELYEAIHWKRRASGIELKPEYFRVAIRNLKNAERQFSQRTLFDLMDTPTPARASYADDIANQMTAAGYQEDEV